MSQLDARLGRGYSTVGSLSRLPATPAPEWHVGFDQNDILSPARSAALRFAASFSSKVTNTIARS
jgi:hypothetical protein